MCVKSHLVDGPVRALSLPLSLCHTYIQTNSFPPSVCVSLKYAISSDVIRVCDIDLHSQMYLYIYLPLRTSRMRHKVNLKRSLTGLNSEFPGCHIRVEEPSLPYYLPIA